MASNKRKKTSLAVSIGGLKLKNPILTASGTFGYGEDFAEYFDLGRLGGIVVKGLSLKPTLGNPPPRIAETPAGMLNAIGLQNIGIERFIEEKLPFLRKFDTKILVNIYGHSINEYSAIAERLEGLAGVHGIEVNISCPNVKKGGMAFGTDPKETHKVVQAVRKKTSFPLIVKLSPNVTDITAIARAAEDAGADALSVINTLLGMAVDIDTRRPLLGNITGGLSGPAIKPVALRMVWQVHQSVKLPLIGIGGIMEARDALEFIICGASAVQIGTANFLDPLSAVNILQGIEDYLLENRIEDIKALKGSLQTG
jgi:dihydroorotate dehydrogenase (NAD+) catalytic subunit